MILSCPACGARFLIDDDALPAAGRQVRCGRCQHAWRAEPGEAEAQEAAAGEVEATAGQAAAAPAPEPTTPEAELGGIEAIRRRSLAADEAPVREEGGRGRGVLVGWALLVLVVAAVAAGLWFGRERIVAAVPETARYYEMAGIALEAPGHGLAFRTVERERRLVDGEHVLVVEGEIVNHTEQARAVPPIRAALLDAEGRVLAEWTFRAASPTVAAGAVVGFATEAKNTPRRAESLDLSFVAPVAGG